MSDIVNTNALIKQMEDEDTGARVNFTVRLPEALIERFKKACGKIDKKPARVIEKFVAEFTAEVERTKSREGRK